MFVIGIFTGILLYFVTQQFRLRSFHVLSSKIIKRAELEAKEILDTSHAKAKQRETESLTRCQQMERNSLSLKVKEEKLGREKEKLQKIESALSRKSASLKLESELIKKRLEEIAGYTREEVRQQFHDELERESTLFLFSRQKQDLQKADQTAIKLIVEALERLPKKKPFDYFTTEVVLPNEEMKAKIIGREGKNIKTFQMLFGVTLIVDDTPLKVFLSSFNPERREIAKIGLTALINDGQINSGKIEIALKAASQNLDEQLIQYGLEAASRAGVTKLHPELLKLLGQLKLRSSLGQNLLDHSVEVSHIMAILAAELKLDVAKAKRIGLLHDIGKAASSQTDLSHAKAGYQLALQWGESEDVAIGIACHHQEVASTTLEAALCKPADHLSASLLGVRNETSESFYKRLQNFEQIAMQFAGVETAFAMEAGKELQVFVKPEVIDESEALRLAKDIASKIEEISPNNRKVQIIVIRQTQSVEYSTC